MKKLFFLTALMAGCVVSVCAQKPVVYCENFSWKTSIGEARALQIRSAVVSAIQEVNRVHLIDAATEASLQSEAARRTAEAAMNDATARTGLMQQLGAEYILSGFISQFGTEINTPTSGDPYYTALATYTLKITKADNGTLVASKDFNLGTGMLKATGSTEDEAVAGTLKAVKKQMSDFINEHFKLRAVVLDQDFETKKDAMTTCYVSLGSDAGIEKGQMLDVAIIKLVAGRETEKVIATLKVDEVAAGDLSQCKVTKGGVELLTAMKDYLDVKASDPEHARELVVITKKQGGFGGALKDLKGKAGF